MLLKLTDTFGLKEKKQKHKQKTNNNNYVIFLLIRLHFNLIKLIIVHYLMIKRQIYNKLTQGNN